MKLKPIQIVIVACAVLFSAMAMNRPHLVPTPLEIKFINTSDDTIKNFVFNEITIGDLNPTDTSDYFEFDSVGISDNNRIMANATAFYRFGDIEYYSHDQAPAVKTLHYGKFTVDVNMYLSCGIGFDMFLEE